MLFEECHPFVRYARELTLTEESVYVRSIPYDARLFYVLAGEGEIRVDGRAYPMREGSVLFLPPATPYQLLSPTASVTYFALNFDLTMDARSQVVPVPPAYAEPFCAEDLLCPVWLSDVPELNAPLHLSGMQLLEPSLASKIGRAHV